MAVYVDSMRAGYRRMIMCHMMADSTEELLRMADAIGVKRRWLQCPGSWKEHFDICLSKRALAVKLGAIEVSQGEMVRKFWKRPAMVPATAKTPSPEQLEFQRKKQTEV